MTSDLVLIPGLASDAAVWRRTIIALGTDVRCTVGNTLEDETLEGMAQRILADAPGRFALAGVSMGGMIAIEMMRMAPDRVHSLALVDTIARPATADEQAQRLATNAALLTAQGIGTSSSGNVDYLVHPSASDDVRQEIAAMGVRVGRAVYIRQNLALVGRRDLRCELQSILVPCAVVVGAEDQVNPVPMSVEIHNRIGGSCLHILPDCGHLPPIEKPEVMAEILLELLSSS